MKAMTLDKIHAENIKNIKSAENSTKIKLFELEIKKKSLIESNDLSKSVEIMKINDQIDRLQNDSKNNLVEYYKNNAEILFEYYDSIENVDSNAEIPVATGKIMDFFSDETKKSDTSRLSREGYNKVYHEKTDEDEIQTINTDYNCYICKSSNLVLIPCEGVCECKDCGYVQKANDEATQTSYKDPPKETAYYAYKRANHFNEWLSQFQGKETSQIPSEVIENILKAIQKDRKKVDEINHSTLRDLLKRLKYNRYYENIPYILATIKNDDQPLMTRREEEVLKRMFREIQRPFISNCPQERKNFLSYSYVLHKFCEILEWNHFKELFPLLKSREKLHSADQIWKKVCNDLNWKFYKSI
jgi:hypothetical protein